MGSTTRDWIGSAGLAWDPKLRARQPSMGQQPQLWNNSTKPASSW